MNANENPILAMMNVTDFQKPQAEEAWQAGVKVIWKFCKESALPFLIAVAKGIWTWFFLPMWQCLAEKWNYLTTTILPWFIDIMKETLNWIYNVLHHFAVAITNCIGDFTLCLERNIQGHQYLDWNKTRVSNDDFATRHLLQIPHCIGFWAILFWASIAFFSLFLFYFDLLDTFLGYATAFNPLTPFLVFCRRWLRSRVIIREPVPGQPRLIPNGIYINGLTAADVIVPPVGRRGNIHTHHQAMRAPSNPPRNHKRLIPNLTEAQAGYYPDEPGVRGFEPMRAVNENAVYAAALNAVLTALGQEQALIALRAVVAWHVHAGRGARLNTGQRTGLTPNLCVTHSVYTSLHVGCDRALADPNVVQMLGDLLPIAQDFHLLIVAANMTAVTNRHNRLNGIHTPAVVTATGFRTTEHWG